MIAGIIDRKSLERLSKLVRNAHHIVITCHLSPDGDAVGSSLALCRVLNNMGKDACVVVPDQIPRSLLFMPGVNGVVTYSCQELRGRFLVNNADLIFCLDFNCLKRIDKLGALIEKSTAAKVMIDHHLNPETMCDIVISFPQLSSTCELIYRTLMEMGWLSHFDKQAASNIYVGMTTDTGNFTYSSNYPEIYEILADLMTYKIDKERLYNLAMNTFSADCLRIQGFALSEKMEVFADKGVALITLSKDELERFNYKKGDTEGLVNKPLAIPEVHMSFFLREDQDNYVKVSTRSQGDFAVNEICARHFNGGGHKNAAGGEFYGSMAEAVDKFKEILSEL